MSDSDKTNDPHDTRLSELFGNKEAFISFLKDCVKAPWINDLDEESLRRSPKDYVLQDFKKKRADVVYEGTLNKGKEKIIFFVLQENQSRVDYRMPYRLLLYIVEILRDYYNHADPKERKRKNFKFPAVFPIVFHTGSQKWTTPLNLKEMFYGYKNFGDYLLDFNYAIVDAKGYDDEGVKDFRSKLLKVMMLFERSKGFTEVLETVKKYKDDVVNLNDEEKRILNVAVDIFGQIYGQKQSYKLDEIVHEESVERVDIMLVDWLTSAKNYERNLKKEGRQEEKIETAKTLLEMGDSVEKVAKATKLSIAKVEKIKEDSNL